MTHPKSLAERLEWMAENLPGFRDELNAVEAIARASKHHVKSSELSICRTTLVSTTAVSDADLLKESV